MKRIAVLAAGAALLGLSVTCSAPAHAAGCQGWNGAFINAQTCDSWPYPDGSYDHCTYTRFGPFQQTQCTWIPGP